MTFELLLPHGGRMRLLDRVLAADAESLTAELQIRAAELFERDGGVGSWVGIEYMGQAIAAWAGHQGRSRGEPPKIGFLLGVRRYDCARAQFRVGERLRVDVQRRFQADNGLGQFDCCIWIGAQRVATAILTVYQPDDATAVLQGGVSDDSDDSSL
jgi:predicted hotdog family 3-hydroxylacyl-ACP dehydratase